jgi:hypothetical protein
MQINKPAVEKVVVTFFGSGAITELNAESCIPAP